MMTMMLFCCYRNGQVQWRRWCDHSHVTLLFVQSCHWAIIDNLICCLVLQTWCNSNCSSGNLLHVNPKIRSHAPGNVVSKIIPVNRTKLCALHALPVCSNRFWASSVGSRTSNIATTGQKASGLQNDAGTQRELWHLTSSCMCHPPCVILFHNLVLILVFFAMILIWVRKCRKFSYPMKIRHVLKEIIACLGPFLMSCKILMSS